MIPTKSDDIAVTRSMLFEVRDELLTRINGFEHRIDGRFDRLQADIHRIALLVEDQNARNKFVLDGYASIYDRQEKLESRVKLLEK